MTVLLPGRLGTVTARDVMTPRTICLRESDTVASAVQALRTNRISGAPVVDSEGRLVGILSVSDLARCSSRDEVHENLLAWLLQESPFWQFLHEEALVSENNGADRVARWMSRQVASVLEAAPLVEVARVMCAGHFHRVPVVDCMGRLCGIISTMDILAALVHAADEAA